MAERENDLLIGADVTERLNQREKIKAEYVRFNHKLIAIQARANATGEYAELEAAEEQFYDKIIALFEEEIPQCDHVFERTSLCTRKCMDCGSMQEKRLDEKLWHNTV